MLSNGFNSHVVGVRLVTFSCLSLFCFVFCFISLFLCLFTTSLLVGITVFLCDTVLIDYKKITSQIVFYILFTVILIE